jgi:hypothetical protein
VRIKAGAGITGNRSLHQLSYITVQHKELQSNALHQITQPITLHVNGEQKFRASQSAVQTTASKIYAQILHIKILLHVVLLAATFLQ